MQGTKQIRFDVYNTQGDKTSKILVLSNSGITEFKMNYNEDIFSSFPEFEFLDLTVKKPRMRLFQCSKKIPVVDLYLKM
jgi:hypothetical protein